MKSNYGILLIAHGSRSAKWVGYIEEVAESLQMKVPLQIGFLELVPGRGIADGVARLQSEGAEKIIVIPLFITMGSTHLNEIQYALGIIPEASIDTDLTPIPHTAKMIWCSPLEDDWTVLQILSDRILSLSSQPDEEWLLLLGHGSEIPGFQEKWEQLLENLCTSLNRRFGFQGASYATLHPDSIHERSLALTKKYRVITVPVFLSEGYFTRTLIPRKLVGNVYDGKTLLPHPLVTRWIKENIQKTLTNDANCYKL